VNLSRLHALCACVLVVVPPVFCLSVGLLVFGEPILLCIHKQIAVLKSFVEVVFSPSLASSSAFRAFRSFVLVLCFHATGRGICVCVCILKSVEVFFARLL
jgi:hypothetical protein